MPNVPPEYVLLASWKQFDSEQQVGANPLGLSSYNACQQWRAFPSHGNAAAAVHSLKRGHSSVTKHFLYLDEVWRRSNTPLHCVPCLNQLYHSCCVNMGLFTIRISAMDFTRLVSNASRMHFAPFIYPIVRYLSTHVCDQCCCLSHRFSAFATSTHRT